MGSALRRTTAMPPAGTRRRSPSCGRTTRRIETSSARLVWTVLRRGYEMVRLEDRVPFAVTE
jgi:hypothetical protein